jgi:hypothetical protein
VQPDDQWAALLTEHEQARLGLLWIQLTESVVRGVCRNYPAGKYGATGEWTEEDIEDLVQDVIEKRLITDGQIEYIVAHAKSVSSARGLIGMHVKQTLAARLVPTQADRVGDRLWDQFQRLGEAVDCAGQEGYRPPGSTWEYDGQPFPVSTAANVLSRLPRLPNRSEQRLSPVFSSQTLKIAAREIWSAVQVPVRLLDVREISLRALTGLIPTLFHLDEDLFASVVSMDLSPEEVTLVEHTVSAFIGTLSADHEEILASAGIATDSELAMRLGVSRQTVIKRRHEATALLLESVRELDPALQDVVAVRVLERLGASR